MSEFLSSHKNKESSRGEIDFEDAIRLPGEGSTCETYRTRWQRREVFVKRLKEEFRANPLYLDALDKEYEIGVNLKHPSLPDYREFHRDYIVMDFIDGVTLSEMIKRKDPWLAKEKNIVRLFRELIDVTDYLHRHNVTHCDIKPDNIMITNNNRNVVLIDLDNCYTDSFNDTSGDPSKYGLSDKDTGRVAIDFHGIGRVAEKLKERVPDFKFSRYRQFVKECFSADADCDKLLSILDYNPGNNLKKLKWMITLAPFVVALLFGFILWLIQGGYDAYKGSDGIIDTISSPTDTLNIPPKATNIITNETNATPTETLKGPSPREEKSVSPFPKSPEQIHKEAQEMAVVLDKRIQPYFDELNAGLDSLESLSRNPDITPTEFLALMRKLSDKEDEYCEETFAILKETFPGLDEREAWRVIAYSKAYTGYKRRAEPLLSKLSQQILSP